MTDAPLPASAAPGGDSIFGQHHLTRFLVAVMIAISCAIYLAGARATHWPTERDFVGSLAQPPVALAAFILSLVLLVLCTWIGTLVLSRRFFLGGLMAATAGLTVLAARGGTATYVLFTAHNTGAEGRVFWQLLVELVVWFAVIGGLWNILWASHTDEDGAVPTSPGATASAGDSIMKKGVLIYLFGGLGYVWLSRRGAFDARPRKDDKSGRSMFGAIAAQAALMVVFVLILVATPQKKQVLTGVFLAGLASTAIAENFFANRAAARWYWVGPLVVGAFGYLANYFSYGGIETGDASGMFGAMARVLPLDYASLGCAGTLLGYWWMMPEDDGSPEELEPAAAA